MDRLLDDEEKVEMLDGVRHVLRDEKSWTKKRLARDHLGAPVSPQDKDACQWCLLGAIDYVNAGDAFDSVCEELQDTLVVYLDGSHEKDLMSFNDDDETTHSDVIKLLDTAIEDLGDW